MERVESKTNLDSSPTLPIEAQRRPPSPLLVEAAVSAYLLGEALLDAVLPSQAPRFGILLALLGILLSANRIIRLVTNSLAGITRYNSAALWHTSARARGCSRGRTQEYWTIFLLAAGIGVHRDFCARSGDRSRVGHSRHGWTWSSRKVRRPGHTGLAAAATVRIAQRPCGFHVLWAAEYRVPSRQVPSTRRESAG